MFQITLSSRMWGLCVGLVYFLILFSLTKGSVVPQQLKNPAKDFTRYRLVQPTLHHGRTKRELSSTRDTNGAHHSEVTMTVDVEGQDYVLDLRLNEDLVSGDHTLSYQKGGKNVLHKPKKEDLDLCHYSGSVRGMLGSWVALSTCHGVRGAVYDGKKMRFIEPADGGDIQSNHYLYDHNDLNTNYRCGNEDGVTNNTKYDPELMGSNQEQQHLKRSRVSRYKRNAENTQVRGPYNADKHSRYVELVLVADHGEYLANRGCVKAVLAYMTQVANIINSVYAPLNIFITLVGVVVWSERDEIRLEENSSNTLNGFLKYREKLVLDIPNDNAHLLTHQTFTDGIVGKAPIRTICTHKLSGGVSTKHSEVIGLVATTIAHEMGHNFGMNHDLDEDCVCAGEKCIMNPTSTSVVPVHWSSCSVKSLAVSFERGLDYCLRNKPTRLAVSPTCGNGYLELGEQCDCGPTSAERCRACCHHDTCMLRSNATCATGVCCDVTTCRPKAAGTVCRSADQECDLPEYCTGQSEFCPDDVFKMDTIPCGDEDQAYCAHGWCRSQSAQCRLLWGNSGETSHDMCYNNNVIGDKYGNCGYDQVRQYYKPCHQEDAMCGLLQCTHLGENNLEFGSRAAAKTSGVFIHKNGTLLQCQTATIDLGLSDVDPGLVPDGAKCGQNKICMKQRCLPIETIQETISNGESSVCPSNCSGHGVCNSLGHCHCDTGFAPPLCAVPGPGGSYDSGPATDPTVLRNFMIAMFVIFLGIIPSIVLVLFLVYYSKYNVLPWRKRPGKSYVNCFNCCNHDHTISPKFQSLRNIFGKSINEVSSRSNNKDDSQVGTMNESKSTHIVTKSPSSMAKSPPSVSKSPPSAFTCLPSPSTYPLSASKSPLSVSTCLPSASKSPPSVSTCLPSASKSPPSVSTCLPSTSESPPSVSTCLPSTSKSPPSMSTCLPSESKSSPSVSKSPLNVSNCSKEQNKNTVLKNNVEPIYSNCQQFSKDNIQTTLSASKSTIRNGNSFNLVKSKEELSKIRTKPIKYVKDDIQIINNSVAKNVEEKICLETKKKQLRKVNKDHIQTLSAGTGTKNNLDRKKEQNSIVNNRLKIYANVDALSDGDSTTVPKENRPNLVVIKQGLASTTNSTVAEDSGPTTPLLAQRKDVRGNLPNKLTELIVSQCIYSNVLPNTVRFLDLNPVENIWI